MKVEAIFDRQVWLRAVIAAIFFSGAGLACADVASVRVPAAQSMQHGLNFFSMGRFEQAIEEWQAAADSYRKQKNVDGDVVAHVHITEAYAALGRFPDAIKTLNAARELLVNLDRPVLQLAITSSLGNTYVLAGNFDAARETLILSIRQAGALKNDEVLATAHNNLGNLYLKQNRLRKAVTHYRHAAKVARRSGDVEVEARATINQARSLIDIKQGRAALLLLKSAGGLLAQQENSHHKAQGLITVGRLYSVYGDRTAEAERFLKEGGRVAQAIYDTRAHSFGLGYLAQLYEREQRFEKALRITNLAIRDALEIGADELLYRWQWQQARLMNQLGEPTQALIAYRGALKTLQQARRGLNASSARKHSFFESAGRLYADYAALLMQQSDAVASEQQRRDHLMAARDAIEAQKVLEFQGYFTKAQGKGLPIDSDGVSQLKLGGAAIYTVLLPQRLELLVSLPDDMKRFVVKIDAGMLASEIELFRKLLAQKDSKQHLPHAKKLYKWLFAPLEETLASNGIETVVVVPDSFLHALPVAALNDGEQSLLQRFDIANVSALAGVNGNVEIRSAVAAL